MDKLTDMLTNVLDSQPTPQTPDPPDVGKTKKITDCNTRCHPTYPPSKETLNQIPPHLRDNVVRRQDSGEVQLETFANQNNTSADSFPGPKNKNRL